tara:strand:- start:520 stop:1116 length:597 start_codon:yes stop_codon:yes gene_type:complete
MPIIPNGNDISFSAYHGSDRAFDHFNTIENARRATGKGLGAHCTASFDNAVRPAHYKRISNRTNPDNQGCFIYGLSITANENEVVTSDTLIKDVSSSLQMALIEQYPEHYSPYSKVHDVYCNLGSNANVSEIAINSMFVLNGIKVITNISEDKQGNDSLLVLDDSTISIQYIKKELTEDGISTWADIKESTQELSLTN